MRQQGKRLGSKAVQENLEHSLKSGFNDQNAQVVEKKQTQETHQKNIASSSLAAVSKLHTSSWTADDKINIINPISKSPHLRSKVPLKRINIIDITSDAFVKPAIIGKTLRSDDLEIIERTNEPQRQSECLQKSLNHSVPGNLEDAESSAVLHKTNIVVPTTSVQFFEQWKQLNGKSNMKYELLKQIQPSNFPNIFKESLDNKTFTSIITVLAEYFVNNSAPVYEYLHSFTKVKRFSTLVMFMSANDKNGEYI